MNSNNTKSKRDDMREDESENDGSVSDLRQEVRDLKARIAQLEEGLLRISISSKNNNYNTGSKNGCKENLREGTINGTTFPQKENAAGFKVGDKVSIQEHKTLYDPHNKRKNRQWIAVYGVVVGHTCHFVDIAIEHSEEGSIMLKHVRKKNEKVFR